MGNLIQLSISLPLLFIFLLGCGKNISPIVQERDQAAKLNLPKLTGNYTDLTGSNIDLATLSIGTQVIIFAQETCAVCSSEATHLFELVSSLGLPSSFTLRHLLVGANLEDAQDWVNQHHISWPAGIVESTVFRNYCPAGLVPCLIIYKQNEGIVSQQFGKVDIQKLTEIAGPWKTHQ